MFKKKNSSQKREPSGSLDNPFPKTKSSFTPKLWIAFALVTLLLIAAALVILSIANNIVS